MLLFYGNANSRETDLLRNPQTVLELKMCSLSIIILHQNGAKGVIKRYQTRDFQILASILLPIYIKRRGLHKLRW
jgi:hypothetical protein